MKSIIIVVLGFLTIFQIIEAEAKMEPCEIAFLKKGSTSKCYFNWRSKFQCDEAVQYLRTQSGCKKYAINGCLAAVLGCKNASEGSFKEGCDYIKGKIIGYAEFPTEGRCEGPARKAPAPRS